MDITAEIHGTSATLTPHGDIDFQHLDQLRHSLDQLPSTVTAVTWDLRDTSFVDVACLHLLRSGDDSPRETGLANLRPQPRRFLAVACEVFPDADFHRYLDGPGAAHAA
ncbi:STAS domain-containing protein [Streptomyces sp. t39]|uniref:STAS domain-containing protein n=1 Tax=Streptomyces sp. t39 TaxID=1828156 RepID=UPI0011CD3EEC|nr:STAS domain-containing protein [Streptomyces sp. t39]TXS52239.1 anti-sigma factor antagonist [Streptomyces sp. t39]